MNEETVTQEVKDRQDYVSKADLQTALMNAVRQGFELGLAQGRKSENEAIAGLVQRELLLNAGKPALIGSLPAMIRQRVKA